MRAFNSNVNKMMAYNNNDIEKVLYSLAYIYSKVIG